MSDRKYRHRGYQDDDRDRDRDRDRRPSGPRGQGGPARMEGAPRGRGVGAPTHIAFKCSRCGREIVERGVAFDTTCPGCGSALHSCTNCTFFDTGARFECRKPLEARVEAKGKANTCEYFQPKAVRELRVTTRPEAGVASPNDARAAFDALFKK